MICMKYPDLLWHFHKTKRRFNEFLSKLVYFQIEYVDGNDGYYDNGILDHIISFYV